MALPFVAFLIDWQMVSSRWIAEESHQLALWAARLLLVAISLFIAFAAAVAPEKTNLQKALLEHETKAVLEIPDIKARYDLYNQQIADYQKTLIENGQRMSGRSALMQKWVHNNNLAEKERLGVAGIDEATGVKIDGGQICGPKCNTYIADATAAKTQLDELDAIPSENEALRQRMTNALEEQKKLFDGKLSDINSFGSLLSGVLLVDGGIQLKIALWVIMILTMELSAFLAAHLPIGDNLVEAVKHEQNEDALELSYVSKMRITAIHAEHANNRAKIGANLPPVVVQIPSKVINNASSKKTSDAHAKPSHDANNDPIWGPQHAI